MAKQIVFNGAARQKMLRGMEKLARAVEVTLGASGPGVVIQHRTDGILPLFTRDGATVANSIHLDDRLEDLGARMLRDVAAATARQAGDGTTTAVVLARKIAAECAKSLAAGARPTDLKRGIDAAVEAVCLNLRERAVRSLDGELIRKICRTAGKEGDRVADGLMQAIEHVGPRGKLTVEPGHAREDELDIAEGVHFPQGYLSPYFTTDRERHVAELDAPYILLYDREITDFLDLVPLLEEAQARHRSLLIIAQGVSEQALAPLLLNHVRGNFRAVAVKPPGYGDRCQDRLQDLAVLTGGRACMEVLGDRLARMTLADLGQADRAVIGADGTGIFGAMGDRRQAEARIAGLELEAEGIRARKPGEGSATGNRHDLEELEERIDHLRGRTATYKVGGGSDLEIRERLVRVENAGSALRAALEEGVLAGGGVGLLSAGACLGRLVPGNADQKRGIEVVGLALAEPLRRIARNAGLDGDRVVAQVKDHGGDAFGFDAVSRTFGNLFELGVVDPVKMTRMALKNAAGIVGTVITTEAVIAEQPIMERFPNSAAIARWAAETREDPRI